MEHQNRHADGDADEDILHLDRQRGGRLGQLAGVHAAVVEQHREQHQADGVHQDAQYLCDLLWEGVLHEGDGDVAAVAVDAGRAEEGGPDQQIARHFVGPGQRREPGAADDLRPGDDHHRADHEHDHHAADLVQDVADLVQTGLYFQSEIPPRINRHWYGSIINRFRLDSDGLESVPSAPPCGGAPLPERRKCALIQRAAPECGRRNPRTSGKRRKRPSQPRGRNPRRDSRRPQRRAP